MVITGWSRKPSVAQATRGFESHSLRHDSAGSPRSGGADESLRSDGFEPRVASLRALNEQVRYIQAK